MIISWYSRYLQVYEKSFDEVAFAGIISEVRSNLKKLQSNHPLVTVSIIAYNEEKHLLACLWALSEMKTHYPIEIIGVNNDSKDRTADIYHAVDLPYYTELQHSCGHARLCGLMNARGKYHINIDADTLYPPTYVDAMIDVMEKHPDVMGGLVRHGAITLINSIRVLDSTYIHFLVIAICGCSLSNVQSLASGAWCLLIVQRRQERLAFVPTSFVVRMGHWHSAFVNMGVLPFLEILKCVQ